MISFSSFIQAIQGAVNSANEQLTQSNTNLIDQFFIKTNSNLQNKVQGAINALEHISKGKSTLNDQEVDAASEVIKNLTQSMATNENNSEGVLTPKTVAMEYPIEDESGKIQIIEIQVPLITLTPICVSQIHKAVFNFEFEMELLNNEVQIHLSESNNSREQKKRTRGSLEIELTPSEPTEGLKTIIENYEKVLKSQLH